MKASYDSKDVETNLKENIFETQEDIGEYERTDSILSLISEPSEISDIRRAREVFKIL